MARGDSFTAFLQGFSQGFDKNNGFDKLSSYAAKNIAGGEYYNPQDDPQYYRELQRAQQLGTETAKNDFVEEYGQYADTGDKKPAVAFGLEEPEQPTYMGMAEDAARKTILGLAQQGKDVGQFVEGYNKTFENNLNQDFVGAFSPEEPTTTEKAFSDQLYSLAVQGDDRAQRAWVEKYPDIAKKSMDQSNIPRRPVSDESFYDILSNEVFQEKTNQGFEEGQLYSSNNFRQLNDEQIQQLQSEGYNITELPNNPGWYSIKSPIVQNEEFTANDYKNRLAVAESMMSDDNITESEQAIWNQLGYEGNPSEFVNNNQTIDFGNNPLQTIASRVVLGANADNLVNTYNQQTPDALNLTTDMVNNYIKNQQPDQGMQVDLGQITGNEDLSGNKVTLDQANSYLTLMGKVQGLQGTQTQSGGSQAPFGVKDIKGATPDGKIVYGTDEGANIVINEDGSYSVYTGELAGQKNQNNNVEFEIPGSWEPLGTDKWGNTDKQVWLDDGSFLRYPDGSYVTDQEGNYWAWNGKDGQYTTKNPDTDLNIPAFQKEGENDSNFIKNLAKSVKSSYNPNLWPNLGNNNQEQKKQTGPVNKNNQNNTGSIGTVIDMYKNQYSGRSNSEIAELMNKQSDEWKQNFKQNYGVPVQAVIDRLKMMDRR